MSNIKAARTLRNPSELDLQNSKTPFVVIGLWAVLATAAAGYAFVTKAPQAREIAELRHHNEWYAGMLKLTETSVAQSDLLIDLRSVLVNACIYLNPNLKQCLLDAKLNQQLKQKFVVPPYVPLSPGPNGSAP